MNHIMPLLLRLTVDMVVAWKQGLSSQYTKLAKSKEEKNSARTNDFIVQLQLSV